MFCPKCGSPNDDNAFKCLQCGAVIQAVPPPVISVKQSNAERLSLKCKINIPDVINKSENMILGVMGSDKIKWLKMIPIIGMMKVKEDKETAPCF